MLIVYKFWGNSCPPCKIIKPEMETFVEKNKNFFHYKDMCTDDALGLKEARNQNITSIPTITVVEDGQEIARLSGLSAVKDLKDFFLSKNLLVE